MLKTELLADIAAKGLKVVSTIEEPDTAKNAAGIKQYLTHVMEQEGTSVRGRNIGWYTFDEGLPTEAAYYRDIPSTKRNFIDAVENYLNTITPANITTGSYIRAEVTSVKEKEKTAVVKAFKKNADATATPVDLLVWKNGAQAITHVEII